VRSIDPGGFDGVFFQAQPADTFGILPSGAATQQGTTPFSVNFHFTPGYEWQSSTLSGTDNTNNLPVFGEHSYSQTFNNAVFGPSPQFGPMVNGNEVEPSTLPWGDYLLDDPTQGLAGSFGLQPASSQAWLYRGSKLLAHSRNGGFAAKISATPAWYTMKVSDAAAGTGAGLFTSETLSYNFRAWAGDSNLSVTNFWPLITPSGLNWLNAAKQGTKTTVRVYFKDLESDSDPASNMTAHSVKVWASANGGKTWTAVRVTESGPHWSAVVTNPAKAGHVSLRVQGTDSSGFTASVTVSNAYAVS